MTLSNDFDRQIAAFLADGPIELPDRSFDSVRTEIERTRQRGSFLRWRVPAMSDSARLLTTAVVVVVAFVGFSVLGSRANLGTAPTPVPCATPAAAQSAAASVEPTEAPAPSASESEPPAAPSGEPSAQGSAEPCPSPTLPPAPIATPTPGGTPEAIASASRSLPPSSDSQVLDHQSRPLAAGTYSLGAAFPVAATLEVPDGWFNCPVNPLEPGVCTGQGSPADPAGVSIVPIENIVADPCVDVGLDPPVGRTIAEVVAAIRDLEGFESTEPVDITVGGRPAMEFTLTAPPSPSCQLFTWSSAIRTNIVGAKEINRLRVVDVDGAPILIAGVWSPAEDPPPAELIDVFESVRFPSSPAPTAPTAPPPSATTPPPQDHQSLDDEQRVAGRARLAPGFPVEASIDVPAGWQPCLNTPLEQSVCGPVDGEVGLMFIENVVANPCSDVGLNPPAGPTVDDLVSAIRNLDGFESTDPVDITVDGHSGKEFTLTAPLFNPLCNEIHTWFNGMRTNGMSLGEVNHLRIVDVDGTRVLLAAAMQPGHDDELPEVLGVLDSIRFP